MNTEKTKESKKVGVWIRVSTDEQAKGDSPRHHKERAKAYAKMKEWEIVELYDLSGTSGKSVMDNPKTQRMIADVKTGRIKALIFTKLARLARNLKELINFSDLFQEYGADLISIEEGFDTSTPAGKLLFHVIGALAQWEREEISARVAASIPIRAALGEHLGGHPTFGYQVKDKKLVPYLKEAPIRKFEYELFIKHKSLAKTVHAFNKAGYRLRPNKWHPEGAPLTDVTLKRHLQDPTPKGLHIANYTKSQGDGMGWKIKPEGEWKTVKVPAILSDKIWNEAKRILKTISLRKRTKPPAQYLLSGYVYCGVCKKSKMYAHPGSNGGIAKYRCAARCGNGISLEDLDNLFLEGIKQLVIKPGQLQADNQNETSNTGQIESRIKSLKKSLGEIDQKIDSLIELWEKKSLSHTTFKERITPLEIRKEQIAKELPRLEGELVYHKIEHTGKQFVLDRVKTFTELFPKLDTTQKKILVDNILEKVVINKDQIQFMFYHLPEFYSPTDPDNPDDDPKSNLRSKCNSQHNHRDSLPR
ncbi:MAG: recombinase family protein [Candidatus Brocadiia bacterium]